MRDKLRRVLIVPRGKVENFAHLRSIVRRRGRLHDIEPIAVDEERVITEQSLQPRYRRVTFGDGLGLELSQRSLHQCGRQFHWKLLLSIALALMVANHRALRVPPTVGW